MQAHSRTAAAPAASDAISIDPAHDYDLGRYRDREALYWPHGGQHIRIGMPAEYRGALLARGYSLPPKWPDLPRCIVVSRQASRGIERIFIPEAGPGDEIRDLFDAYSDDFGFHRARQLADLDPYVLVDFIGSAAR